METILGFASHWLLHLGGALVGMAKVGIYGSANAAATILALALEAKASTGIMLPMMLAADIIAVLVYRHHANWKILAAVLPWAVVGIGIGTVMGHAVDGAIFARMMAVIVLISLGLMLLNERSGRPVGSDLPEPWRRSASIVLGIAGGISTMVGNLGGPVMILYLLYRGLDKNAHIGTMAWLFFAINVIKVAPHVLIWQTIDVSSLWISATALPAIAVGAAAGVWVISKIPAHHYRRFIVITTALSALALLAS